MQKVYKTYLLWTYIYLLNFFIKSTLQHWPMCSEFYFKQGDQMSVWKSRPKCSPTHFRSELMQNFNLGNGSSWKCASFESLIKQHKVNKHPLGEKSPNPITLPLNLIARRNRTFGSQFSCQKNPRALFAQQRFVGDWIDWSNFELVVGYWMINLKKKNFFVDRYPPNGSGVLRKKLP
jgi:hypothetical protein